MIFSIYKNSADETGSVCTYPKFWAASHSSVVRDAYKRASDGDDSADVEKLPQVSWGISKNGKYPVPSGLCSMTMLQLAEPYEFYQDFIERRVDELGVGLVAGTLDAHELFVVFKARPEFTSLHQCREWFLREVGLTFYGSQLRNYVPAYEALLCFKLWMFGLDPEEGTQYK